MNEEPELQPAPVAEEPAPPEEAQAGGPPADDDVPEAVEVRPGERMVPVGVLKAVREQLKPLKGAAEELARVKSELDAMRPYADFVRANPQLLQPQAQPAQAPPPPESDPELVEIARTLDLYDPTGQPDVKRADKIREMNRQTAKSVAEQVIAPVQTTTNAQRAAANIQHVMASVKDGDGNPISEKHLIAAVKSITSQMPEAQAVALLADPAVVNVLGLTALGIQASAKRGTAPPRPSTQPLHVESAGGQSGYTMTEDSRRLARAVGRSEADWTKVASRYVPGRANSLE